MTNMGSTWQGVRPLATARAAMPHLGVAVPLQRSRPRRRLRSWADRTVDAIREALRPAPRERRPDPPNPRRDRFMESAAMQREMHRL